VFEISPLGQEIDPIAADIAVTIRPLQGQNCAWTATTTAPFITFRGSSTGVGTGSVTLSVTENRTGVRRSGTVMLGGQTYLLIQRPQIAVVVSLRSQPGDPVGN